MARSLRLLSAALVLAVSASALPLPADAAGVYLPSTGGLPIVYQGEDAIVTKADFNHKYLGTRDKEGVLLGCVERSDRPTNVPACWGNVSRGYSETWIHLTEVNPDPAARAGVGLRYELKQACVDQPFLPITPSVTYAYTANVSGRFGFATAEIWANAFEGRGTPGSVEVETGNHDNLHRFALGSASGNPTMTLPVYTPSQYKDYTALVYSFAHAGRIDQTDAVAHSDVGLYLQQLKLDWSDATAPTASQLPVRPDGSSHAWTSGPGARTWFRSDLAWRFTADDPETCPKKVDYTYTGDWSGGASLPVAFNKSPVYSEVFGGLESRYDLTYTAFNGQGMTTSKLLKFGVDKVPPTITVNMPTPEGEEGWIVVEDYALAAATESLSGSGVSSRQYRLNPGTGWLNWPNPMGDGWYAIPLPEGSYALEMKATDYAGWVAFHNETSVKVDKTAPTVKAWCTMPGVARHECGTHANPWYNQTVTVETECTDGASGCEDFTYVLDGGAPQDAFGAVFPLAEDGVHALNLSAKDHAGHRAWKNYTLQVDRTPPTKPDMDEVHGKAIINVDASWVWGNSTDATSGGVVYSTWFEAADGSHSNTSYSTTTSWTAASKDGRNCLSAVAKDAAGNVGERSDVACVLVDKTKPTGEILRPVKGGVYVHDQYVTTIPAYARVVALGPMTFESRAWDPVPAGLTYASGLAHSRTLMWGQAWRPSGLPNDLCPTDGTTVCRQMYHGGTWSPLGASLPVNLLPFNQFATDAAGNPFNGPVLNVDQVKMVALTGRSAANLPAVDLHWIPYDGEEDFVTYEIHRSLVKDFIPTIATRVDEVAQRAVGTYQHTNDVQPGVTYYYQVVVVTGTYDALYPERVSTNEYPAVYDPLTPQGAKKAVGGY